MGTVKFINLQENDSLHSQLQNYASNDISEALQEWAFDPLLGNHIKDKRGKFYEQAVDSANSNKLLTQLNSHNERPVHGPDAVFRFVHKGKKRVARKIDPYLVQPLQNITQRYPNLMAIETIVCDVKNQENALMISSFIEGENLLTQAKNLQENFTNKNAQVNYKERAQLGIGVLINIPTIQNNFIKLGYFYPDFKLANILTDWKIDDIKSLYHKGSGSIEKGNIENVRTASSTIAGGTTYYFPPEVLNSKEKTVISAKKMFSYQLGLLIYEALVPQKMHELKNQFSE